MRLDCRAGCATRGTPLADAHFGLVYDDAQGVAHIAFPVGRWVPSAEEAFAIDERAKILFPASLINLEQTSDKDGRFQIGHVVPGAIPPSGRHRQPTPSAGPEAPVRRPRNSCMSTPSRRVKFWMWETCESCRRNCAADAAHGSRLPDQAEPELREIFQAKDVPFYCCQTASIPVVLRIETWRIPGPSPPRSNFQMEWPRSNAPRCRHPW